MLPSTDMLLGEYGARLDSIDARLVKLEENMEVLIEFTAKFKGGWGVILVIAGLAGFLSNLIMSKLFGRST